MIENQSIIHCIHSHYGIDIATLSMLPIGADLNAAVYKAQTLDQASYFVKLIRSQNHTISVVIVELLQNAKVQQLISPIKTLTGQPTQHIEDFTLIVYPFIEGQNGFNRKLTDHQWKILGETLRKIHEIEVPPSIQTQLRQEEYSPKWRDAVKELYPHMSAEPFKSFLPLIYQLVDRSELLASKVRALSPRFVLCHSDIHGGNVLMNDNFLYLVDWDDPIMAPKERDLMFIGGGVANVWNEDHEEKLFYEGYGKTEANNTILAYYRLERIVEDIAIYGQELIFGSPKNKEEITKHFNDMFEPRGVVEIAFKTFFDQEE